MVGLLDDSYKKFPTGSRIKLLDDYGTVKYVGEITGHIGMWIGVEWDDPIRGKHNGSVNGHQYFQTEEPQSGSFIRPAKLTGFETVEATAKKRYLNDNDSNLVDENLMREAQQCLHAAVFEIVGMEKIAKKQAKIEDLEEISVEKSMAISAGDMSQFKNLISINLSSTLLWNWKTIAEICEQIPTLADVNLSCNRLLVPSDQDVANLTPYFKKLKNLNLRKCQITKLSDIQQTAKLWPQIEKLSLRENNIQTINQINCENIFVNLRELDLHRTGLNFENILPLGEIHSLKNLILTENNIKEIQLPHCDFKEKLKIFLNLEVLNVSQNPLNDNYHLFNELDKLPSLIHLCKTPMKNYEDMFSFAVSLIQNLKIINKALITGEQRRGAEYELWKKFASNWIETENNVEERKKFCEKFRSYSILVKKHGSPVEFIPVSSTKKHNLLKLLIQNPITFEIWNKKVPRKISLQTLQGLIIKNFKLENHIPKSLFYYDENHPDVKFELNDLSKTLDFYSVPDDVLIIVEL